MKTVKVLGSGCKNCQLTASVIQQVSEDKGIEIKLIKVENVQEIMAYSVMKTPAVVVDEVVVHKGSVPNAEQVAGWL